MSMSAEAIRVSSQELEEILASPDGDILNLILDGPNVHQFPQESRELAGLCMRYAGGGTYAWDNIKSKAANMGLSEEDVKRETKQFGFHHRFDVGGQLWNELHLLLTGKPYPISNGKTELLSLAVTGGDHIPWSDTGYGPVRYLKAEQVKAIANELAKLSFEGLLNKHPIENNVEDDVMEEVFSDFKTALLDAANNGDAVLCMIT
jgi:Domain of unknown function (DUF1877)